MAQKKNDPVRLKAIFELLQIALQSPSDPSIYNLIVATWAHCEAKPAERDVEKIVEGVALFPRNTLLAFRSALVCAQNGYAAQAAELIDQGLVFATDEFKREYLDRLNSKLAAPADSRTR